MIYKTLTATEINQLNCISDIVISDNKLKSFKIHILDGFYMFEQKDYYGIVVTTPEPDVIIDVYSVSGVVDGIEIKEKMFEDVHDAEDFLKKLDKGEIKSTKFNKTLGYALNGSPLTPVTTEYPF